MNKPKTRNENIVVQEFDSEVLIYDLINNKAFCLNQTSAMVWGLCDGKHSTAEITKLLSQRMNQPITEDLIWLALDGLKKEGLLENEQFEIDFNGLSRRQVIKKIGFASLVTLPVIASVVAPAAATAASLLPLLARCSSPSQCQSGDCNMNINASECCVPGSFGLSAQNGFGFNCCSDPPSCNLACCTGVGTLVDPGICPTSLGLPLRVFCP